MDLDDVLDAIVILGFVASVLAGVFVAIYNYRSYRLIKQLRADPVLGPKIDQLIKDEIDKQG